MGNIQYIRTDIFGKAFCHALEIISIIFLYDIQRDGAFSGTPVADTDCIGICHTESFTGIEVDAEIQTEQVSYKKILRIGVLLVVYENIDDAGKSEGISHISLQVMKLKETDHLQISDMIGFGNSFSKYFIMVFFHIKISKRLFILTV